MKERQRSEGLLKLHHFININIKAFLHVYLLLVNQNIYIYSNTGKNTFGRGKDKNESHVELFYLPIL
jgi:hypothetical protein